MSMAFYLSTLASAATILIKAWAYLKEFNIVNSLRPNDAYMLQ